MARQRKSAATTKARRGSDPVRVSTGARVSWYPSGTAGVGPRRTRRCQDADAAAQFADQIRADLATKSRTGQSRIGEGESTAPLHVVMTAFADHLAASSAKTGTRRQYVSNFRTWVPDQVKHTPCLNLSVREWTLIFDELVYAKAHPGTITAVARTLGALITFGMRRGYFNTEPFSLPRIRRDIVKEALAATRADTTVRIRPQDCPGVAEVDAYAHAFECVYPGYGKRLVLLAFATGLRICELLALQVDDINLRTGEVAVTKQLDRYGVWPQTRPPKSNRSRTAISWAAYQWVLNSLVADAETRDEDPGWLFPRHRSQTKWADQAGHLAAEAAVGSPTWRWTFHWLRHAHATLALAPVSMGGYGLDPKSVSEWLGHSNLTTTLNLYVTRVTDDVAQVRQLTSQPPGAPDE